MLLRPDNAWRKFGPEAATALGGERRGSPQSLGVHSEIALSLEALQIIISSYRTGILDLFHPDDPIVLIPYTRQHG